MFSSTDSQPWWSVANDSTTEGVAEPRDVRNSPVGVMPWDTSDPFFSVHTRELMKLIFKCCIRQAIIFFGIPGNVLCCLVFWKQGLSDRINLLLFWLAVVDLINLTSQLSTKCACYFTDPIQIHNFSVVINATVTHIYLWAGFVSGALVVVMSVDRCLFVTMPLKARNLLTYRSMVMAIVVCYVVPFVLYLTAVLGNTVKWRVDPSTNRSIAYSVNTSWFPPDGKIQKYLLYYLGFISQPLFFIVVVVCSVVTVVNLRKTYRKRLQMTGARTEEGDVRSNKITTMLLCLCVIYTVIFVPRTCAAIIYTLFPEFNLYRKYHNSFFVVYQIFMLTASCVNSAVNFFAYLALSSKFRRDLKEVCSCFSSRLSTAGHQR